MKYSGPAVEYSAPDLNRPGRKTKRYVRNGMTVFVDKVEAKRVLDTKSKWEQVTVYRSADSQEPLDTKIPARNLRPVGGKAAPVQHGMPEDDYTVVHMKPHCDEENCDMGEALYTCPNCGEESYDGNLWYKRDAGLSGEDIQHTKCVHCGAEFDVNNVDVDGDWQWVITGKFERDPWV
jgi:DNA-directed RNA polymerase subunit RPC12/RpoP